jgi:putative SOS response-associated peptidase YedK
MKLTDITIRALESPAKGATIYYDNDLTGFGVRVSEGGTKSFILTHGPQRTRETIGRVGIIGLKEARIAAKQILAEYTLGKNRPKAIPWKTALGEYLTDIKRNCRKSTHTSYKRHLEGHFKFGDTKMHNIAPQDYLKALDRLKDRPSEYHHAFVYLRAFIRWAFRRHYIEKNPLERMKTPPASKKRKRVLTDAELKKVWDACPDDPFPQELKWILICASVAPEGVMCGKFTAMATWAQVVAFSQPLTMDRYKDAKPEEDRQVTYRVMSNLPVIVWNREGGHRRVVPMRWGFPHPKDWRRPQPIHARSETIEITKAFADAFLDGQRGIVLMKTFNEAPDIEGSTIQHAIRPGEEYALAAAFVWRRFEIPGQPVPLLACCLVTVPANNLIATLPTDRMPAFLAPVDWEVWLGEEEATVDEIKACLKTVEGVKWTMTREEVKQKARRAKPTASDPGGLN